MVFTRIVDSLYQITVSGETLLAHESEMWALAWKIKERHL